MGLKYSTDSIPSVGQGTRLEKSQNWKCLEKKVLVEENSEDQEKFLGEIKVFIPLASKQN